MRYCYKSCFFLWLNENLHLCVSYSVIATLCFATNDGNALYLWSHSNGCGENITYIRTLIEMKVFYFANVSYRRLSSSCLKSPISSKSTCRLGYML